MPDRTRPWEEELLLAAADRAAFPATPDIAGAVRERLSTVRQDKRGPFPALALRMAMVAAVVAVAASLALAVSRDVRHAVADFLGLGVQGEVITRLPTPAPNVTPTPLPTPQNIESFATPVTASEAATALGFAPVVPAGAGDPLQIYLVNYSGARVAVLHYSTFDLWEEDSGIFEKSLQFVGKGLPEQTVLEQLTINARPAYWIRGGAHLVTFSGADGKPVAGSQRTVLTDTLVWRGAAINYRLEGDLDRSAALALAQSLP